MMKSQCGGLCEEFHSVSQCGGYHSVGDVIVWWISQCSRCHCGGCHSVVDYVNKLCGGLCGRCHSVVDITVW